jgi:hypothetical protein
MGRDGWVCGRGGWGAGGESAEGAGGEPGRVQARGASQNVHSAGWPANSALASYSVPFKPSPQYCNWKPSHCSNQSAGLLNSLHSAHALQQIAQPAPSPLPGARPAPGPPSSPAAPGLLAPATLGAAAAAFAASSEPGGTSAMTGPSGVSSWASGQSEWLGSSAASSSGCGRAVGQQRGADAGGIEVGAPNERAWCCTAGQAAAADQAGHAATSGSTSRRLHHASARARSRAVQSSRRPGPGQQLAWVCRLAPLSMAAAAWIRARPLLLRGRPLPVRNW